MDPLARLFGSPARLKLLRLFLFNDDTVLSLTDASFRSGVSKASARKEIQVLIAAGVIRKRAGKGGGYTANRKFTHYEALALFLRTTTNVNDTVILEKIRRAGLPRLIVLSGLFTAVLEPKIDLLIVGDRLDDRLLTTAIRFLEAELGRELRYASFSTEDFKYRIGVYDRLIRDVLDYPHRTILDRIGI